jgi:hypothetical protein
MKLNLIEKLRKKIWNGLGNNLVVVVLLIILFLFGGLVLFGYYHSYFIAPRECCIETVHPITHTEYGYYTPNDFLRGNNLILDYEGLMRADYYDSDTMNMSLYQKSRTWVIHNTIDDTIPFRIYNPATSSAVEGIYTPNISIAGDILSTDILIINWNDTVQKGSCYQISTQVFREQDNYHMRNEEAIEKVSYAPIVNNYKEIRVNISLDEAFANSTSWQENTSLKSHQIITISEKNCINDDYPTRGSWAVMPFALERR